MIDIFNIFISLVALIFFTTFFVRFIWQKNRISYLSSLVWLFYLSSLSLLCVDMAYYLNVLPHYYHHLWLKSCVLTAEYTYFSLAVISFIRELTTKKVKTLWRLPIIGLLIGMLFSLVKVWDIFIVTEIAIFAILFKFKQESRYIFRNHIKSLCFLPIIYFFHFPVSLNLLPIFICFSWYFKLLNINAVVVKNHFLEYDNKTNEDNE